MEKLHGSGGINDLDIVLGGEPQKAFEPRAGMFRAGALEAVGQQEHEAAELLPFVFAARDELIDDRLRDVPEITELRLPQDEAPGAIEAEAVFETEHAGFAQGAVDDFDGTAMRKVLEGKIFFAGLVIV